MFPQQAWPRSACSPAASGVRKLPSPHSDRAEHHSLTDRLDAVLTIRSIAGAEPLPAVSGRSSRPLSRKVTSQNPVITPPKIAESIVEQAAAIGVKNIWFQPGAESEQAVTRARILGINVISGGPCLLVVLGYHEAWSAERGGRTEALSLARWTSMRPRGDAPFRAPCRTGQPMSWRRESQVGREAGGRCDRSRLAIFPWLRRWGRPTRTRSRGIAEICRLRCPGSKGALNGSNDRRHPAAATHASTLPRPDRQLRCMRWLLDVHDTPVHSPSALSSILGFAKVERVPVSPK